MLKKMLVLFTALAMLTAFCLPAFGETVKGKVTAYDKEAKKISIDDKEYTLSDEALSTDIALDDEVEADIEADVVNTITK
jgi:hypothetical protein